MKLPQIVFIQNLKISSSESKKTRVILSYRISNDTAQIPLIFLRDPKRCGPGRYSILAIGDVCNTSHLKLAKIICMCWVEGLAIDVSKEKIIWTWKGALEFKVR